MLHGFTAFPYNVTPESTANLDGLIQEYTNLYAIHRDQECLPWQALLTRTPLPAWLEQEWQEIRARIPAHHTVYVAITPTQSDRTSIAYACGHSEGQAGVLPPELEGAAFNHPLVKQAYLDYARRVVAYFKPSYLVIGIEISELALKHPDAWQAYAELATYVSDNLHRDFPDLHIGSEFVLQSLLLARVGDQVKDLIEASDFLGISFYPYGSTYGESLGASALPDPPAQWREPLTWLNSYTTKPIGISETGYTSEPQVVDGLRFEGDRDLQKAFLRDILKTAAAEHYLFFIWFIAVDYDKLYLTLPDFPETGRIWVNSGLFDQNFQPKPAWDVWRKLTK